MEANFERQNTSATTVTPPLMTQIASTRKVRDDAICVKRPCAWHWQHVSCGNVREILPLGFSAPTCRDTRGQRLEPRTDGRGHGVGADDVQQLRAAVADAAAPV